ncbi:MAG: hypothetical protein QOD07_9 [Frankiaceae bacterium]|jgi:hypothetical protein|nr:hypothetical protein [Frankiaceae bacterium]
MTPKTGRVALRQTLDIWASGLRSGAIAAAIVLPFGALGIAWGAVVVLTTVSLSLLVLMARNYNDILLFAMRRGADTAGPRDAAALREVFEEFAAERRAASAGHRRAVETWPFRLSKWLAGFGGLGVGKRPVRSAGH